MKFKPSNRFYLFGLVLMVVLYFFGGQGQQTTQIYHTKLRSYVAHYSFHDTSPLQQPAEIENKEEQPETEDDEINEFHSGTENNYADTISDLSEFESSESNSADSHSKTQHHTPAYVRLRTILI
ncbi:MAG: hypothetical protein IPM77_00605 [Crocinitomicaceae bacterium]|nr:hypothetical protein [Crocinitomicaceae bacterium]